MHVTMYVYVCHCFPAQVVAHVLLHAVAAALQGGGGKMLTHDVSLDEPVSQLTFYRMVQAAVARTRSPSRDPAAAFRIDFGRSVLGRVSGVLYSIGTTLGAKVMAVTSWQLQQPPQCARASHCRCRYQASCKARGSSAAARTTPAAAAPSPACAPRGMWWISTRRLCSTSHRRCASCRGASEMTAAAAAAAAVALVGVTAAAAAAAAAARSVNSTT